MNNSVVSLNNVSFGYDDKLVLEDIKLDIYEGDYLGIIGSNGSAKSTLIKLILNTLKPLKGEIKLFNRDIHSFKDWNKIGYVDQKSTSFNKSFPATVEEVVGLNLFSQVGLFRSINKKHMTKVNECLKIVGMDSYRKRLIGNLSGGEQQKIFIARALVNSPKIIFLDEPTVGIDLKSQEDFYCILEKLNKEFNITIVMISHDIEIIAKKANRLVCMANSRLTIHDNYDKLSTDKILKYMYSSKNKTPI